MSNTIITNKFEQFTQLISTSLESIIKAAQLLVAMLDEDKHSLEFISSTTKIPMNILEWFEKVGRQQLLPNLVWAAFPAVQYVRMLPMSEQRRLIVQSEPIDVVILKEGKPDILKIKVENLTGPHVNQVFTKGRTGTLIRSPEQQRGFLEASKVTKLKKAVPEEGYQIKGKNMIHKGRIFTKDELIKILAQLK